MESSQRTNDSVFKLVAAACVSLGGFLLFVLEQHIFGYALLSFGIALGFMTSLKLGRDLTLIGLGIFVMSVIPVTTDISYEHMFVMGVAMLVAVTLPYLISRYWFKDYAITYPWHFKAVWTREQWWYLAAVLLVGYFVLPFYMISTGVYQNWPAVSGADETLRLFLGTNGLGIWDELFFICTVFVLLRRHLSFWVANILQGVLFTSFLFELGFEAWGPLVIFIFTQVQGYIFEKTHSLFYVVTVHLLFDLILFLVLLHAHSRQLFPIFLY